MREYAVGAAETAVRSGDYGHPIDLGLHFQEHHLPVLRDRVGRTSDGKAMPYLAALLAQTSIA